MTSDFSAAVIELVVSVCFLPLLSLLAVGVVQYARHRDRQVALRSMVSWWALFICAGCCVLTTLFQMVTNYSAFLE